MVLRYLKQRILLWCLPNQSETTLLFYPFNCLSMIEIVQLYQISRHLPESHQKYSHHKCTIYFSLEWSRICEMSLTAEGLDLLIHSQAISNYKPIF